MSRTPLFELQNLHVSVENKEVLKGVSLKIYPGEVHAIMGRNGSGKTTLSYTIMGHPKYTITEGKILFEGKDLSELSTDERSRAGVFLAFQYPVGVPGVSVGNFLRTSVKAVRGDAIPSGEIRKRIRGEMQNMKIPEAFLGRFLNDSFSGGEKKKLETLQLKLLEPKFAVLDETDSGLDIDALRSVSETIEQNRNPQRSILLITHYQRILNYVKPDFVHVFMDGRIVKSGESSLALELEEKGYDWIKPAAV